MLGTAQDITDRKNAEEIASRERSRLKEYFECLPVPAYNISFDGTIEDLNRAAVKTLGYDSREELIGKPLVETVYAPESRGKARSLFQKWKTERQLRNEELKVITRDGRVLEVLLNVDTILDHNGEPVHSLSTHLDITARKKTRRQLAASEEKYRTLIESLNEGVWQIDENACTTYVNPKMAGMLGYQPAEMVGKHLFSFMSDEAIEMCKHYLQRRHEGIEESHEFDFLRKTARPYRR